MKTFKFVVQKLDRAACSIIRMFFVISISTYQRIGRFNVFPLFVFFVSLPMQATAQSSYSSVWFRTEQEWVDFWILLSMFVVTVFFFSFITKLLLAEGRNDS